MRLHSFSKDYKDNNIYLERYLERFHVRLLEGILPCRRQNSLVSNYEVCGARHCGDYESLSRMVEIGSCPWQLPHTGQGWNGGGNASNNSCFGSRNYTFMSATLS